MKVVKPLKLGILHRAFEFQGRCFWTPCVMAFFDFSDQPALLSEIDMWKFSAEALGKDAALDTGMPKERAEVLVSGDFQAPGGKPQPAGRIRLTLGGPDKTLDNTLDKTLFIFGDRYWKKNAAMTWGMSEPEPIQAMPITYPHAFGGPRHKPNPLGKGMVADIDPDGAERIPLPNIELPHQLVVARSDKPDPAGFGPIDLTWPQRAAKSGTYDQHWYDTRFPGLADDIDWTFFNTAPEDQQLDGFFNGDERFSIEGMHAEKSRIESGLPDIRPRLFIARQKKESELIFEEVELRMDTLWLFPNAEKGVMIYHGLTEVQSDTAKDILHLVAAYEKRSHSRRDIEHYRQALDKRLDREKGFLAMLDESDLIGEGETSGFAEMMVGEEFNRIKGDDLLKKKQKMRSDKDIDMVRDMISQQGLDPDKTLPKPVTADIDIKQFDFDEILKDAEQQRLEAEKQLEKQLESLGITREQLLDDAARQPAPRPFFSAKAAMEAYAQIGIDGERIQQKMEAVEKAFNATYRQVGHHLPPVLTNGAAADMDARKAALIASHAAGESLKGADLAGMDLSGLDLEGIDLQDALLEDAVLSKTNLRNANLNGAALMRSDLQGADLTGAALKDAGLGRALLGRADLNHADLSSAVLAGADLTSACLKNACLDEADLSEAKAGQADLRNATLKRARCIECDLKGIRAAAADMSGALIYKTDLSHADLTGATLQTATLVEVNADNACCRQADLGNLRAAVGCCLQQVDFEGAKLTNTNLRGGRLAGARFVGAELSQCDFSEADLKGCDFSHATAKQTLFIEADLTDANLAAANCYESLFQKTRLHETDFKGANLFGVDFMKAQFRNTDMRLALLHKSTLNRWIPK